MEGIVELKMNSMEHPQTIDFDLAVNLAAFIRVEAEDGAAESFNNLHTVLSNILAHPNILKFRRLRLANPLIHDKLAQYKSCVELLELLGFQRTTDNWEEVLEAQNFQAELAQIVLDLIPSNSPDSLLSRTDSLPVKIPNRTEFLASVHEQRVQSTARANMFTRISQRPPDKPNRSPALPSPALLPSQ